MLSSIQKQIFAIENCQKWLSKFGHDSPKFDHKHVHINVVEYSDIGEMLLSVIVPVFFFLFFTTAQAPLILPLYHTWASGLSSNQDKDRYGYAKG